RRHTRFSRDWSSDVCSSDLAPTPAASLFNFNVFIDIVSKWVVLCLALCQRSVCRRDQAFGALVEQYAGPHAIHRVGEAHAVFGIGEGHGAAGADMPIGAVADCGAIQTKGAIIH